MGVNIPPFDSLAQGLDYASVPTPDTDAANTGGVPSTQHVRDSTNDTMSIGPVSLETKSQEAPLTGDFLKTNIQYPKHAYLNPEDPIF